MAQALLTTADGMVVHASSFELEAQSYNPSRRTWSPIAGAQSMCRGCTNAVVEWKPVLCEAAGLCGDCLYTSMILGAMVAYHALVIYLIVLAVEAAVSGIS